MNRLTQNILNLVIKNWNVFKTEPVYLAWAMMQYELTHRACRYISDEMDNPKYAILDECDLMSKEDGDLLYDSWCVCIDNNNYFPDTNPDCPIETKKNKTFHDWAALKLNPSYEYASLYSDNESVMNELLCVTGTGLSWNADGYIDNSGPMDTPHATFSGYSRAGGNFQKDYPALYNAIMKISHSKKIYPHVQSIWNENLMRTKVRNDAPAKAYLDAVHQLKFHFKQNYASAKVQKKYLKDVKYLCYLKELCDRAKSWSDKEWQDAQQQKIITINGFKIELKSIQSNFSYPLITQILCPTLYCRHYSADFDYRVDVLSSIKLILANDKPLTGCNAIKFLLNKNITIPRDASRSTWYPLSTYSLIYKIPKNAHESYVEAAVHVLRSIVADPLTQKQVLPLAFKILKKLKRAPYYRTDGKYFKECILYFKKECEKK